MDFRLAVLRLVVEMKWFPGPQGELFCTNNIAMMHVADHKNAPLCGLIV